VVDAVSESGGGGVAEPARPGRLGILNAVEERRITVPTRERNVDFFGGVVAIAEALGAVQREGIDKVGPGGEGSERMERAAQRVIYILSEIIA